MVLQAKEMDGFDDGGKKETIILGNKKCVVEKVHITGLHKTKSDYVIDDLKTIMDSKTFMVAYQKSLECKSRLLQKGIFSNVDVIMDTTSHYEGNKTPNGLQVLFRVKEKSPLTGETRTEMSTNDQPCWVLRLVSPNLFGRGEQLTTSFSRKFGSQSNPDNGIWSFNDFSVNAAKPYKNGSVLRFSILKDRQECPWNSSYLTTRGAQVEYLFSLFNNLHSVAWHGHWRELGSLNNTTALPIREEFGHSVKSSLLHTVTMDRTDQKILPSEGFLIKMSEEIAGIGAGGMHLKENIEMQVYKTFFKCVTFSAGVRGGFISPLDNSEPKIIDKFHIGGPMTLRGFQMNQAGPQVDGDFLGGHCYWLGGLHTYLPLPFYWKKFGSGSWLDGFRIHGFINAGNLMSFDQGRRIKDQFNKLFANVRMSYGAGLVYNFMRSARLELNFCMPLKVNAGDNFSEGLQFGIGISNI